MAARLHDAHFNLLCRKTVRDIEYQVYQCMHPTAILFSRVNPNKPIAAVSFLPGAEGGNAKTALLRRSSVPTHLREEHPSHAFLHGLTNVDNECIRIAITNLTDFKGVDARAQNGYVKIDILGKDVDVHVTDLPDVGINQVNELGPNVTYVVAGDQRTGNKTMVLRGLLDDAGKSVSLETSEAARDPEEKTKTEGTRFFIHVTVCDQVPDLVALMKDTTWRCVDSFVRTVHASPTRWDAASVRGASNHLHEAAEDAFVFEAHLEAEPQQQQQAVKLASHAFDRSAPTNQFVSFLGRESTSDPSMKSVMSTTVQPGSHQIAQSQVARIVEGDRYVHTVTHATYASYAFDMPGEKAVLSLSIWRDLCFSADPMTAHERDQHSAYLLKEACETTLHELVQTLTKIYTSDCCVVCLEAPCEVIFYQCGHQCTCHACTTQAPTHCHLCRQRVQTCLPASLLE